MKSTSTLAASCFAKPSAVALMAAAALLSLASGVHAQQAFGRPVLERTSAHADMTLVQTSGHPSRPVAVRKPAAVTKTQLALADITASDASGAQVVTLPYEPHGTYDIPLREGMFTTFSIPSDEPIQQFAVSNPAAVQLQVNAATNTAMLKLVQPITVVGTIVTKKHIFYVNISPASSSGPWYQGVNWSFDSEAFGSSSFGSGVYTNAAGAAGNTMGSAEPSDPANDLFSGQPNFDYKIEGEASFQPQAVWDNGRFTWVQFPKNVQELPALFVNGANGLEIVNYTVHAGGTQLLVNRLMPSFVLKLGKAEITVTAGK